jgi:anti-anti-sigma regulatory factor
MAQPAVFTYQVIDTADGTTLLVLTGDLDMAAAQQVGTIELPDDKPVHVDLRSVTFLDSSGLGALLALANERQAAFHRGPPNVHKVFALTDTVDRVNWVESA